MAKPEIEESHVREAAYHLWLKEGCPDGRDEDHWHKARAQLEADRLQPAPKARRAAKPKTAAAKSSPSATAEPGAGTAKKPRASRKKAEG